MFSTENKIKENRKRIREQFEQYKKIETYYPLFFAYLGFIGVFTFDIIIRCFNPKLVTPGCLYIIFLALHIILIICCFAKFVQVVWLKSFGNDLLPKDVYKDTWDKVNESYPDSSDEYKKSETQKGYLETLEQEVERNYTLYDEKKKHLHLLIKGILISIIIYSILITAYKFTVMIDSNQTNQQSGQNTQIQNPQPIPIQPVITPLRRTNEGKESDSTKILIKEQKVEKKK